MQTLRGLLVIGDVKRGDLSTTAEAYAQAHLAAGGDFEVDAVTVAPYLGADSLAPFVTAAVAAGKGLYVRVPTSNPGAGDLQDLVIDGRPLYQHDAAKIAGEWNTHGNCALVVGATWPQQLRQVREIVGDVPFLVPGVGAQGGDVEALVRNARTADGTGLIVSSSRAILYASRDRTSPRPRRMRRNPCGWNQPSSRLTFP